MAEVRARLARLGLLPGSQYAQDHQDDDPLRAAQPAEHAEPAEWATTALVSAEFDADVVAAVKEFQDARGITVDGIVGPETFRRLEEARWRLGDRVLSYAAAHPTVGEDISDLQARLSAMGFDCGRIDGHMGPLTEAALREFQRNTGIPTDGVCGPATFRALGRLRKTVGKQSAHSVREKYALPKLRTGIAGKLVVLDPSAKDRLTGLSPKSESEIMAELASRVEGRLVALGTQVMATRSLAGEAEAETASERAQFANEVAADLVLSLTLCSDPQQPSGVTSYYYGHSASGYSVPGQLAASIIQEGISTRTALQHREPRPRTWDILRLTQMPTVRIECGNVSHATDRNMLEDRSFVETLAVAIADAIEQFFAPEHVI